MPVEATVSVSVVGKQSKVGDLGTAKFPFGLSVEQAFADGTGSGQADRVFTDQRTLAGSATEDLDLAAVLADIYGATITAAKIKAIAIRASVNNNVANSVNVTRPASNGVPLFMAAGDGISLAPGEVFVWFAPTGSGKAVTAGTGDLITITNGAGTNSVTYDVVILGTSV
jgi:hypothetical protein